MGVSGLQTYIEGIEAAGKKPSITKKVNLKTLSENSPGDQVLVIDLMAMVQPMAKGLNRINGGDFREYKARWVTFLNALEDAGITPWFVDDGNIIRSKKDKWVSSRYRGGKANMDVYDQLKRGQRPTEVALNDASNICHMLPHLLKYDLGYLDNVMSSTPLKECDTACVALAENLNAFAILSRDTDYLIYQYKSDIHYVSTNALDWNTLDTVELIPEALATHLGLEKKQLPLFATLKGNDFLSRDELYSFHGWLISSYGTGNRRVNNHTVCPALGRFIRNQPNITMEALSKFVGPVTAKVLIESVESYSMTKEDLDNPLGELLEYEHEDSDWKYLISLRRCGTKVQCLMTGSIYETNNCLEDYRVYDLPPVAKLMRGLRQRVYGILLYEMPEALNSSKTEFVYQVQERCMTGMGSLDHDTWLKPVLPEPDHPGLEKLWDGRVGRRMETVVEVDDVYHDRWTLFAFAVHPNLDPDTIEIMKPEQVFLVTCLFLLQNELANPMLFTWEVKAFIVHHLRLKKKDVTNFSQLPKARPVQLATIFTRISLFISLASSIVGDVIPRKNFLTYNNFEGALFQMVYDKFEKAQDSLDDLIDADETEEVNQMFNVVTSNGKYVK
jgi:hypothetical protein